MVNTLQTTQTARNRFSAKEPKERTLTENISSWIELVVFLFLLLLLFFRKFILPSLLSLGANVDLSFIVKRLLADLRGRRRDWFRNSIFDVLAVQLTSQNPGPHLGVWDGCRQEEESDQTCGTVIMSGRCSVLPGFGCVCWHVFRSCCSCTTPCRRSTTATFIACHLSVFITYILYRKGHAEDSRSQAVCAVDVQHFQPWARERVQGGVLKSRQEEGTNGVAGQGVNSGSRVLDSTQSHHWGNHLHCLCLHPTTSDKTAWLKKNKGIFIYSETPGPYSLDVIWLHEASPAIIWTWFKENNTTCLSPSSSSDGWLPYNVIYLHRCVFNLWLSLANICKEEWSLKAGN